MNPRPEVISELRSLFKEGATPSRLIRHIVQRHDGEQSYHALIQAYFQEAFGVAIVRGLNPLDEFQSNDLRYSFLNEHLVHDLIQKRGEWDVPAEGTNGASSWLDQLTAKDDQQRMDEVQPARLPELSRVWSQLTPQEQQFIQRSLATANGLYESVKILARLAECLQQQVCEANACQVEDTHTDPR